MPAPAPVAVVIPTHNHPETLSLAVASALQQTFSDLSLVLLGDGVDDDTRTIAREWEAADERVEFLDLPKGARHGEEHRHQLLIDSRCDIVSYCGDDDLLLADHIETMVALLEGRDFVNPLPIVVRDGDELVHLPCDLGDPKMLRWMVESGHNAVSLTGVTHTLDSYRRLPHGWRVTPQGVPTDQYMWQQYLAMPGIRAATGARATTVKLQDGAEQDPMRRRAWSRMWWDRMGRRGFRSQWDVRVDAAVRAAAVRMQLECHDLAADREMLLADQRRLVGDIGVLQTDLDRLHENLAAAAEVNRQLSVTLQEVATEHAMVLGTTSWRYTRPLRGAAGVVRRLALPAVRAVRRSRRSEPPDG